MCATGIGGLTALKLIRQHGSIENILENINKERSFLVFKKKNHVSSICSLILINHMMKACEMRFTCFSVMFALHYQSGQCCLLLLEKLS